MYSRIVAVLCLFLLSSGLVSAFPSPEVVARQLPSVTVPASLASPTTITTSSVQDVNGTMTNVTCVVTLTPDGQQIQEISNCTTAMGASQVSSTLVTESASATPTVAAAFVMPGTSIQVLPVGIGLYCGITTILLAVLAAGTWGRVQVRKAYRQQQNSGFSGVSKGGFTN